MTTSIHLRIRSLIFFIGQALAAILVFVLGAFLYPFPYKVRYRFITSWSHFVIWWAKKICGIHFVVQGANHLKIPNGIILCKHQSSWETLFLQTLVGPQTWVLKKELLKIPFFGWGLSMLEPIAIDRSKAHSIRQLLEQGQKRLKLGRWIIIFPEGKRMPVAHRGHYKRSGALLATETGYPVIPIAHNAGVLWPARSFIKYPGIISVIVGEPIDPSTMTAEALNEQVMAWIEKTCEALPKSPEKTRDFGK